MLLRNDEKSCLLGKLSKHPTKMHIFLIWKLSVIFIFATIYINEKKYTDVTKG